MDQIETVEHLETLISDSQTPHLFLFKHSYRCPSCAMAFEEFKRFERDHSGAKCAFLDVVKHRDVANRLTELSGFKHESPQVIHFKNKSPEWHQSHHQINEEILAKRLES